MEKMCKINSAQSIDCQNKFTNIKWLIYKDFFKNPFKINSLMLVNLLGLVGEFL